MLLYISDCRQDRAYDHKSFLGLNVFKQYLDPGFKSASVRLSACNVEGCIDTIAHDLVPGRALDREPASSLVSSRNAYSK